jgi:hypothetical protein
MRSFSRWIVGLSLLCLLPALLALDSAGEGQKAAELVRAFSAQSSTSTRVPTASPTATATEMPVPRPPDAPCPGGPGIWLPSSLDQDQFTDKLALELMYGSDSIAVCPVQDEHSTYPSSKLSGQPYFAYLSPYIDDHQVQYIDGHQVQSVHTVALIAVVTNERKERQYIVITEAVLYPGATHQLWGGVFQRVGTEWKTIASPGFITELGSHKARLGHSPGDRELVQVGPYRYGILLRSSEGGQGETQTEAILIAEVNGRLKRVFSADVAADDYNGCDPDSPDDYCYAYETDMEFCKNGDPEYWSIYLQRIGTERADETYQAIRDATRVQIYEFRDDAYSLVSSPTLDATTQAANQCAAVSTYRTGSSATPEPPPTAWIMPLPSPKASDVDVLSSMDRAAILDNLRRPEVIALRQAMNAYASGQKSVHLDESFRNLTRAFNSQLPLGASFASRYALLAIEPNLINGVNLYIMPQNKPERVYTAWMVKMGITWSLQRIWEAAISPDMDKRRIAAYKLLLSDPELGF